MKRSNRWLDEHFHDSYVKRAHRDKLPARSVYKLSEIDAAEHLIQPNMAIVDLGSSPGGWSTYIKSRLSARGQLWALDILPMPVIHGVNFLQGDFNDPEVVEQLIQQLNGREIDLVCSDMAPNISGINEYDQLRSLRLAEQALRFACHVLKYNGTLLIKLFQGNSTDQYRQQIGQHFKRSKILKPPASRARSKELFLLASGFTRPTST